MWCASEVQCFIDRSEKHLDWDWQRVPPTLPHQSHFEIILHPKTETKYEKKIKLSCHRNRREIIFWGVMYVSISLLGRGWNSYEIWITHVFSLLRSVCFTGVKLRAFSHPENMACTELSVCVVLPVICKREKAAFLRCFSLFQTPFLVASWVKRESSCISFIWIYMTDIWNILPCY